MTVPRPGSSPVTTLDLRPLTPTIGAEVRGIDCSQPLSDEQIAAIRAAWLDRLVLFFTDQHLDDAQQVAFAARFGEVTVGHPVEQPVTGRPQVHTIDSTTGRTNFWHTDITFMARPAMASMLRAIVVPEVGGDTMWADTRAAYETLAPPLQRLCDGLVGVHYSKHYADEVARGVANEWDGIKPAALEPVEHPVVRVHPETQRRNLFVNPGFTVGLRDFPPAQSKGLLRMLYAHMTQPDFTVRYCWQPGTLAFWDNRATMHFGISDYGDARRIMHRVILRGDRPAGPR
jgi:taurine dioxygenase